MYVEDLFTKYADWKILKYFLDNPHEELHVQEVSRRLEVSSGTASHALKRAAEDGILTKRVIGNIHLYTLNRRNDVVRAMRRMVRQL